MGTPHCRNRSWTLIVRINLHMDLAAKKHQLVTDPLLKSFIVTYYCRFPSNYLRKPNKRLIRQKKECQFTGRAFFKPSSNSLGKWVLKLFGCWIRSTIIIPSSEITANLGRSLNWSETFNRFLLNVFCMLKGPRSTVPRWTAKLLKTLALSYS
jgi:hypothetical protein